jgi:hypothetical protein
MRQGTNKDSPEGATGADAQRAVIRSRVLQAIADNRTPGLHFVGHFMGTAWDEVTPDVARISIETSEHNSDADGEANLNMVTTLVDMALANAIRARLSMEAGMRLGTISLHIAFTGVPLRGRLEAARRIYGENLRVPAFRFTPAELMLAYVRGRRDRAGVAGAVRTSARRSTETHSVSMETATTFQMPVRISPAARKAA